MYTLPGTYTCANNATLRTTYELRPTYFIDLLSRTFDPHHPASTTLQSWLVRFFLELDSLRWFSHRCNPSPAGDTQWYRLLLRATAHALLCIVSGDDSAVFRFFCPWWHWPLTFDLDFRTRERFLYSVANRQVWSSRLVVRKLSCGQTYWLTDKHTDSDKQTDAVENIHLASLH